MSIIKLFFDRCSDLILKLLRHVLSVALRLLGYDVTADRIRACVSVRPGGLVAGLRFFHQIPRIQGRPCNPATVALRYRITNPHRGVRQSVRAKSIGALTPVKARGEEQSRHAGPGPRVATRRHMRSPNI